MTIEKLTDHPTEADLNARLDAAIMHALPWLGSVRREIKFRIQLGRTAVEIESNDKSHEARADVLLYSGDKAVAVFELKRPGLKITSSDERQGLSYAKLLTPSPPLVVVTNGTDVRILETHTGKPWTPDTPSEQALNALFKNASQAAASDLRDAIKTLMHDDPKVWMAAVRQESQAHIDDFSGSWAESLVPFVPGWLLPRKATDQIIEIAEAREKLTLLIGPPLSGKSNVLREVCAKTSSHPHLAALFLSSGCGGGIFQALADVLSRSLDWPVSTADARTWLAQVSKCESHKLLILLDDVDPHDRDAHRELEDLVSRNFGPAVIVVAAVHESAADRLSKTPNSLGVSRIGRLAKTVHLEFLSNGEMQAAELELNKHRLLLCRGSEYIREMREPWVLRATAAIFAESPGYADESKAFEFPPMLGIELINQARQRFTDPELLRQYQAIATAIWDEAADGGRPKPLILESLHTYLARRSTLIAHLTEHEIADLTARGLLLATMHKTGESVVYPRLPELVASELARLMANEIAASPREGALEAALNIEHLTAYIPIGDVVAAYSVYEALKQNAALSLETIEHLLDRRPERVPTPESYAYQDPLEGYKEVTSDGSHKPAKADDGDGQLDEIGEPEAIPQYAYAQVHSWLMLSHLGGLPMAVTNGDGTWQIAPHILKVIGKAELPLWRPGNVFPIAYSWLHDVDGGEVVCHHQGIIEPVTNSLVNFLQREGTDANGWLEDAVTEGSVFLLSRIYIALAHLSRFANVEALWAKKWLRTKVGPALDARLGGVCMA